VSVARRIRPLLAAVASGPLLLIAACNALVGNGDLQFIVEAGPEDATTDVDVRTEAAAPDVSQTHADGGDGEATVDAPADAVASGDAVCGEGAKLCGTDCVQITDPGYGCGAASCSPCELPNAYAACAVPDAGGAGDAGRTFACSPVCMANHANCNGSALDGCEVDTSADLYNCGACGHDCSNLPHVAGNVSCVAGVCTFDNASCAPGYGICSTNPDDGCDTVISDPAHCGGCTTPCSDPGHPYCSPTGNTAQPFSCTSGCSAGLSLCGASCVNENADPNHCGACATQCPAVVGGTPTCSSGGRCSFTCNANDHLCGSASAGSCAANNDANNCGLGAACGKCPAPANATATCAGGTTCSYACNASAHACGAACPLDDDPNNCGSSCATNCPGPTAGTGSGVASCNGNACAVTCTGGSSLCGTACVNLQTDSANCQTCGNACPAGQTCSAGDCVCNASSCPNGCCDGNSVCRARACETNGAGSACAAGCPTTVNEASSLALWLVADSYVSSSGKWLDQSGAHADATCSGPACPTAVSAALNGYRIVSFSGSQFFTLSDPGGHYASPTQSWTIFVVANPDPGATTNAQIITFTSGGDSIGLQRSGGSSDLVFQLLPGSSTNSLVASNGWTGDSSGWEWIAANVGPVSGASLATSGMGSTGGAIGTPAADDYASSYLGTDPTQTLGYTGQIAEVVVFTGDLSSPSTTSLEQYLSGRYGGL
jgi:hypothetical protein